MISELITKDLVDNTEYKLIKNAYNDGKLQILLFPRENVYRIECCPNNRVKSFVIAEMSRLYPNRKLIGEN